MTHTSHQRSRPGSGLYFSIVDRTEHPTLVRRRDSLRQVFALAEIPVEHRHQADGAARQWHQDVLVGRMLRAGGVGVWNPDRGHPESVREDLAPARAT